MKRLLLLLVVLSLSETLVADDSVSVPWTEFKKLYRESIERDIMSRQATLPKKKEPFVYTIEEAVYRITLDKESAQGEVLVTGKLVSGDPAPISLFGKDIVIAKTKQLTGGSLLSTQHGTKRIAFLPDGKKNEFQLMFSFMVRPQEDSRSRFVSFVIPSALKNSLSLELSPEARLLEEPGIADANGVYHFSTATSLNIRFRDRKGVSATALIDIDTFSHIRLQGKRAVTTTTFLPVQPLPRSFILQVQAEAQYVSSSLKSSWIKKQRDSSYEIRIPSDEKGVFSIQFAVEESAETSGIVFLLPRIKNNNGKEGDFVVEEPDDGQITLVAEGLVSDIPVAKLGKQLVQAAGKNRFYMCIPPHEAIKLNIRRFKAVSTPPIVLDSQYFFISFEENGSALSVLAVDIPPEIGPRLRLKAIADTEIWSLTVNGRKRKVYTNDDTTWIIPLEDGEISHVQLALLRKGEKLGLHGRLEAVLPETGLPSQTVRVGIALPKRVQLLSLEGPVNPSSVELWEAPLEFVGKPYFFSRSFYKGQGMKLAVSYKEPVDRGKVRPATQQ